MRLASHLRKDGFAHGEQLAATQMGARSGGKRTRAASCAYRTKPHKPAILCVQQRELTAMTRRRLPFVRFSHGTVSPDHPEAWDPTTNPSTYPPLPHPTGGDHWNDRDGYHKLT